MLEEGHIQPKANERADGTDHTQDSREEGLGEMGACRKFVRRVGVEVEGGAGEAHVHRRLNDVEGYDPGDLRAERDVDGHKHHRKADQCDDEAQQLGVDREASEGESNRSEEHCTDRDEDFPHREHARPHVAGLLGGLVALAKVVAHHRPEDHRGRTHADEEDQVGASHTEQWADDKGRHQAQHCLSQPNEAHEVWPMLRLLCQAFRVLSFSEEVADRALQVATNEHDNTHLDGDRRGEIQANREVATDANDGGYDDVGRLAVPHDGQEVRDGSEDWFQGPRHRLDCHIGLDVRSLHMVRFPEEASGIHANAMVEALDQVLCRKDGDQQLCAEVVLQLLEPMHTRPGGAQSDADRGQRLL
mmetsp:Transcript_21578/g.50305  ORF Transcript_21578/g.50305 Transcript_21578/m.50305 type:complete len:360 (+) Transcript_21578:641-1720(+)